jgi:hypothetical protein
MSQFFHCNFPFVLFIDNWRSGYLFAAMLPAILQFLTGLGIAVDFV